MKKINKIIVMVLMIALSIGSFFVSPISGLIAATATVGTAFTLTKVPTTCTVKNSIKIPKGKTDDGQYVEISVIDPAGKEVKDTLVEDGDYYNFTPSMVGDYKVKYTSAGAVDVVSNEYIITVTGVKPTLSFESNLQEIVPAKLGYKNSEDKVNVITLPSPSMTENADDEDAETTTLGRIKKSEAPSALVDKTMSLEDAKAYIGYNVSVRDSKYQAVENLGYSLKEITVGDEEYYEIHYTVSPVENVYGTYRITYTYESLTSGLTASKSMTFEVKKNYDEKTELSYKFKDGATMPTTASAGEEVTLPTPAVTDISGATVSTYTDVEVYFIDAGKTNSQNEWIKIPVENFKFTASYKAQKGAYYLVKYTIKDFFGNTVDTAKTQWTIENVTDKTAPKVYVVKDYSAEDAVVDTKNTAEDMFPTYAGKGQSITLPAIYAEDNISKVENATDSEKEITLTRRVVFNGTSSSFSASSLIKAKDDATSFADSNEVLFTPDKKGEYVIYYEATDKAGNSATTIKKTITVVDSYEDNINPEITLPKVANNAKAGDTITFTAPTAKDYGMINNEKKVVEAEVEVTVDYYFVYENGSDNKADENKTALVKNEDGTYSIAIPTNEQVQKVVLVLNATDNARYSNGKNIDNTETKEIVINVKDVQSDTTAPTLVTSEFEDETFTQVDKKTIQTVKFRDENSVNISVKVDAIANDGTRTSDSVFAGTVTKNENEYTLANATFNTVKVCDHVVTFTATDANGNARIVAYKVTVDRSDVFGFTVDADANPTTIEVGEKVTLNAGVLYNTLDEEIYENATVGVRLLSADDGESQAEVDFDGDYTITAKTEGLIKYQYYAIYNGNEIQIENNQVLTIEAKDTTKPVIEFFDGADEWAGSEDKTVEAALNYEYEESETGSYVLVDGNYVEYDKNNTDHESLQRYSRGYADIEIPAVYVKDANGISEQSVKITTPTNKTIEFIGTEDMKSSGSEMGYKYFYSFAPTGNGPYTVEYSATDKAGNTTTLTYTLQVGDCEEPTLDIKTAQSIESTAKVGDTLKISLNVMELSDNVDASINADDALTNSDGLKLTITITTPDNQTITLSKSDSYYSKDDKSFSYALSTAGEYIVKYTLTDSAKLSHEITKKITVKSESSTDTTSDAIWGTLLVVASVVLLGGVVTYFAVTNKKYSSKKKKEDK